MRHLEADEIDELLVRRGVGTLSMVDGELPYAIPISFGYDPEQPNLLMQWGEKHDSRKGSVLDENGNVSLTVYEQDSDDEGIWRSAVVVGEVYEVGAEEKEIYASLTENASLPADISVWGAPLQEVDFSFLGLEIQNRSGREFATSFDGLTRNPASD
jgi:nitroimidazol reductase NimA-like FMN-containing flavoprotein (pyridoxamine 5'-phosphate oxidase superfamily)